MREENGEEREGKREETAEEKRAEKGEDKRGCVGEMNFLITHANTQKG